MIFNDEWIVDVHPNRKTVIYRDLTQESGISPKKYGTKQFANILNKIRESIKIRKNPRSRVEPWECRVGGIYSYDLEKRILKSRGFDMFGLLEKEIKELEKII